MSSDSRPSFRTSSKNKFKQIFKSNNTSSFRERIISNETFDKIRGKYDNYTDTAKGLIDLGKNKTIEKGFISNIFKSNDTSTSPKGFYDSLFSPQTENDIYLKVAIICLWVIAMLCVIVTIITMFIPVVKNRSNGIKMIFFHVFFCEFCYLIYILLSMINVALDFHLNSFWCDIAKYGMYATVPVMYFALLILSIERLTRHLNCTASWTRIFTSTGVTQIILLIIWAIFIVIISLIIHIKKKVFKSIKSLPGKIIPDRFSFNIGNKPKQCSIDGQLLPAFKILFIILFIILIVLIIKSIVVSTMYTFFKPTCCVSKKKNKKPIDYNMTMIFAVVLLLNLFFSFPFYFLSAADGITQIFSDKTFPMKLKISFIFRLLSIIFQCLIFYTLETNSWGLLRKLLNCATCEKISALKDNLADTNKSTLTKKLRNSNKSKNNVKSNGNKLISGTNGNNSDSELSDDDDDTDDEVFIDETRNKSSKMKKSKTIEEIMTTESDSDDETKAMQKPKLSTRKTDITSKLSKKKDEIVAAESDSDGGVAPIQKPKLSTRKTDITSKVSKKKDEILTAESDSDGGAAPIQKPKLSTKKTDIANKLSKKKDEIVTADSDSGNEVETMQKPKLSTRKTNITSKLSKKKDEIEKEKQPIKRTQSYPNKTNGISKQTSNEKATSRQPSSAPTDQKISKSKTNHSHFQYDHIESDSSTDDISNASVHSDDDIKPTTTKPKIQPTTTKPKIQPTVHSSPEQKRIPAVSRNQHHSHHRRHRTTHSVVSRPIRNRSNNHSHTETAKQRGKSPRNNHNHTEKPKQDRLDIILANSIEV